MVKKDASFLDLKETADFLGVSAATVLQLALEGKLRMSTIPPTAENQLLFLRDDLLRFSEQNAEP